MKKIFKNKNNVKYLLLEKYIFKNLVEFVEFEKKYLKNSKRLFVNCWGNILLKSIGIKDKKNVKKIAVCINKSSL